MGIEALTNQASSSVTVPPQNTASVSTQDSGAVESSGGQEKPAIQLARTNLNNPAIDQISLSRLGKNAESDVKQRVAQKEGSKTASHPSPLRSNTVIFKKNDNNQLVMQVIDKTTDRVLKQYPPEATQRTAQALEKFLEAQKPVNTRAFSSVA